MKRILHFLLFFASFTCIAQCEDEIENNYHKLSAAEFIYSCENLSDSCQSSFVNYYKSLAYFILGSSYLSKIEVENIISNSKKGKEHFIEIRLGMLCYLQMEESMRLKNKDEFEKWKLISKDYIGDRGCSTGRLQYIEYVYQLMIERFELSGDKKNERKYRRKSYRNGLGIFAPKFYHY